MSDSAKTVQFKYDAVVLHSEEEWERAERFCEDARKIRVNGRSLTVITMEEFEMPGKQIVTNLNEAVQEARFIFVSEEYYCNHIMGNFAGNVAIISKIPDKFVKLTTEGCSAPEDGHAEPSLSSFSGLTLGPNWAITSWARTKLEKIFSAHLPESGLVDKIQNLSLTNSNVQHEYGTLSPPTEDLRHVYVGNPSISSTDSMQSFGSQDQTEAKCPVDASTNEGNGSDLTLGFPDLEVDNAEAGETQTESATAAAAAQSKTRFSQNRGAATQKPSLPVPNPEFQAQNPGPEALQGEPQPSAGNPQTPNQGSQTADTGFAGSQPLTPGREAAETASVPAGWPAGRAAATALPCGTTANRVTTFQILPEIGRPETASTTVTPPRPFETKGRSMLDGATGAPATPKPDEALSRRELMARLALERLGAQNK